MNILIQDLVAAAGPVVEAALNAQPDASRRAMANAIEAGGWPEVRVGFQNHAASVLVVICNLDGATAEVARVDHLPI